MVNIKKNKTLEEVSLIEKALQTECDHISLQDDSERAELAWWIHCTFCKGDYRINIAKYLDHNIKNKDKNE